MDYIDLMAELNQTNRPPGSREAIETILSGCHIDSSDNVLDVGCNSGYFALELARITGCSVTGIDLNERMIRRAKERRKRDPIRDRVSFEVANAEDLPYEDDEFSKVVCGGSTPFMQDREQALSEYRRVLEPWGFLGESNYFYAERPPQRLLDELSDTLGAEIIPWTYDYWCEMYEDVDFELYRTEKGSLSPVPDARIEEYTRRLADRSELTGEKREALENRLSDIFTLFNENYEYLGYAVFVLRKRPFDRDMNPFNQEFAVEGSQSGSE